jgi:ATP-dependent protease ClpP protease subunit
MPDGITSSLAAMNRAAEITLFGMVGTEITVRGVDAALKALPAATVLNVRINSPGGSVFEGNAIYNILRRHPARKIVIVEGLAASAASLIAMAGDEIVMPANAFMMVHHPFTQMTGDAAAMRDTANQLERIGETIVTVYAQRTKQPADRVRAMLDEETWLTAAEAVELGFADRVEAPLDIAARFDLSAFSNPPAALAIANASIQETTMSTTTTPAAPPIPTGAAATFAQVHAIATRAQLGTDFIVAQMAAGATAAAVQDAAIDAIAFNVPQRAAGAVQVFGTHQGLDNPANRQEAMASALALRMTGRAPNTPNDPARLYMAMPMVEIARELLDVKGHAGARRMSRDQVIDATMSFGAHTTSDFPTLLVSAGNRVLLESYTASASPLRAVLSRVRDVPDFRTVTSVRLGEFPLLEKVAEHGAIKFGTAAESSEGYKVETHAKQLGITREVLINDDLGAFTNLATWAGSAVAETEARVLVQLLLANSGNGPTMSDGATLFHANHGNLAGSGTVINAASISGARKAMRTQKGIDGVTTISATPKYLLVSPDKETEAETLLAAATLDGGATNTFAGKLTLLVEPRLTGNSWYVFAEPALAPVLEVAYLAGSARAPELRTFEEADFLGYRFRVVHDFGAGAIGWRGAYRNAGA